MPAPPLDDLRRAVKLFNRWQFEEAQTWFIAASESRHGRDREFLQAFANIAAGFHRIWHKGGEANAMVTLVERGRATLRGFTSPHLDITFADLDAQLAECLEEAMRWRRGQVDLFNRDLIPRIEIARKD
jgi:hypothetical protein